MLSTHYLSLREHWKIHEHRIQKNNDLGSLFEFIMFDLMPMALIESNPRRYLFSIASLLPAPVLNQKAQH
jgi:hypothetical protein